MKFVVYTIKFVSRTGSHICSERVSVQSGKHQILVAVRKAYTRLKNQGYSNVIAESCIKETDYET